MYHLRYLLAHKVRFSFLCIISFTCTSSFSFVEEKHTYHEVFSVVKLTCSLFCFQIIYIKMVIVDSQWNRKILAVNLHCVELIAGQVFPLNILTVQSLKKLVFAFYSCNEDGFINREINWLIIINNGVRVVCFGCGLRFNCLSVKGAKVILFSTNATFANAKKFIEDLNHNVLNYNPHESHSRC